MFALPRLMSLCIAVTVSVGLMVGVGGCSRLKEAARDMQPGKAFLDSRIPSGLSPQYFPPLGFVWGAYRSGSLPEARYGVASPPINPKAQVLILADADYPAEVYFELTRQLLNAGYGVWLLEAPGQGGSGRYLLQSDAITTGGAHDAQIVAAGFAKDIIHPTADKPLFIIGTGYSAITALSLSGVLSDKAYSGFVGFAPYLGGPIDPGKVWHSTDVPKTYWGGLAQAWQSSNPDLRLRMKSEVWQKQTLKAYTDVSALHVPVVSLGRNSASVLIIQPKSGTTASANTAGVLCAHLPRCRMEANPGPQALGDTVTAFIRTNLAKS